MSEPLRILLLADDQKGANTIHQHIQAFSRYSRHQVRQFNPRNLARSRHLDLNAFDVVVIHYSLAVIWDNYFSPWFREQVAHFDGLKVQFIQDEYRHVDEITGRMREMGIDLLYSVIPEPARTEVYGARLPDTEILETLTGYVPDEIVGKAVPAYAHRPVDVGYRGRSVPLWLGRLGHEKVEIGRAFLERAAGTDLRCDIAWTERSRIYGDRWYEWIASCRAMLGSESGSSIVDFDGSIEAAVLRYVAENPHASYETVERDVLLANERGPSINAISPRVFEAAAMRTALIMFPGSYSGVAEANRHYLPLEKDFSNFDEVVEALRDRGAMQKLSDDTYDDLIASGRYSYRAFVAGFDEAVAERARPRGRAGRFPAARLRAEEVRAGRTYRLSMLYSVAREATLLYLAGKVIARSAALRRLSRLAFAQRASEANAAALWDDVLRLALLGGVQSGAIQPAEEPFRLAVTLSDGRLTLTSRRAAHAGVEPHAAVADAIRSRSVREMLWNHAPVGQYLGLPLPFSGRSIYLDVGRYDAYGVYRFEKLAEVARDEPDLVLAALAPLLSTSNPSEADKP